MVGISWPMRMTVFVLCNGKEEEEEEEEEEE
jgi:hypothetical protein